MAKPTPKPSSPPAKAEPDEAGFQQNLRFDLPASVVVFLVAVPLCLGIAVASGAPPLSGLIAGIVGGIVVGALSGSHLAVSGPAAGLTTIVLAAISELGFEAFLMAGVLAGGMQVVAGVVRAGIFAYYIPSSVIKGMLASIGIILIMKQVPHALGDDLDFEGDLTLLAEGQMGPFEALTYAFRHIEPGALLIACLGLAILIGWAKVPALAKLRWLPAPLVVVLMGVGINLAFGQVAPSIQLAASHLVSIPVDGPSDLLTELTLPAFSRVADPSVWASGFTIAAVASIETLLCIEAIDKLDPYKRSTPTNQELIAQGAGNAASALLGGLPLTAVIVRGSANVHSGARTKMSSILHGVWLVIAVVLLAKAMNLIPLAALAAILLHVGYKLANWQLMRSMWRSPLDTMLPFACTIAGVLLTDLLKGVGIGLAVGLFFVLRENLATPYFIHSREQTQDKKGKRIRIELSENVSFLNKAAVNRMLQQLPRDSTVEIDGTNSRYIHADVVEILNEFDEVSSTRGIDVELLGIPSEGRVRTVATTRPGPLDGFPVRD